MGNHVFDQYGLPRGALITPDGIKKYTPIEFLLSTGKCYQKSKLIRFGLIGRHHHVSKMAPIVKPQIHELAIFFSKKRTNCFRFCAKKLLKKLQIGTFWADWQTPHWTLWGPKYLCRLFCSLFGPLFNLDFV